MRYTAIRISPHNRRFEFRYEIDETIEDSDLVDDYYNWQHSKDCQWFKFDRTEYVMVFYEPHPFFNCTALVFDSNESTWTPELSDNQAFLPFRVVEAWAKKTLSL